jgi:hypothetical protein
VLVTGLNKERQEIDRYVAVQAVANIEKLADKTDMWAIVMMKQEAPNVAFGRDIVVPPMVDASSTSSVTSTPSRRAPLEPRMHGAQTLSLGAHLRIGMTRFSCTDLMCWK